MQSQFGNIDGHKLGWLLQEAMEKLRFVACVSKEDDTSSELAGYEINKLLNEEINLEERYAELLRVRGTLKGISNKRKLEEIQKEIEEVAYALKESTKKLGRLFRENPDLKKEAEKVANERVQLVGKIGGVLNALQSVTPSFIPCQVDLINEMDDQDSLRQLMVKEKGLLADIKNLYALLKSEEQIYQSEIQERTMNIQSRKETLERGRADAEVEKKNLNEEINADTSTRKRLQDLKLNDLDHQIEKLREKKAIENQVFQKLCAFLKDKENQKKEEIQQWNTKSENALAAKQEEIDKLNKIKEKASEELRKLKEEYEMKNGLRIEKERKQLEREEEKRKMNEEEERLDEAIKRIQENYRAWKEAGGTVKKKKKGKKKAKK